LDPVFVAADEPPDPDWLPADVVVLVCAVEPPDPDWLPIDVDVYVWPVERPDPALLHAADVVLFCALELPEGGWLEGVEPAGVVVADVLVVVSVDVLPVDGAAEEEGAAGVEHHLVVYVFVVLPVVCDPEAETGVVEVLGTVLAEVFDELWVLELPPLTVG
jgi:hypothetical protein